MTTVMPGLVPGIHAGPYRQGSVLRHRVDGRVKPGHDDIKAIAAVLLLLLLVPLLAGCAEVMLPLLDAASLAKDGYSVHKAQEPQEPAPPRPMPVADGVTVYCQSLAHGYVYETTGRCLESEAELSPAGYAAMIEARNPGR
ncbi:MAG: hypothetical protein HY985_12490 [Magnetospirillum sp.]|nr:hypothetical protein [Magnetospirillum sp.]